MASGPIRCRARSLWGTGRPPRVSSLVRSCGALTGSTALITLATRGNNMFNSSTPSTSAIASLTGQSGEQVTNSDASTKPKFIIKVNSLEELDKMSSEELKMTRLAGASRRKLVNLMKKGIDYDQAKRTILKENFLKMIENPTKRPRSVEKDTKVHPRKKVNVIEAPSPKQIYLKPERLLKTESPVQRTETPHSSMELSASCSKALYFEKIAVVLQGYPKEKMDSEKLRVAQQAIISAMCDIPPEGPQVRFHKCVHRPGYLLITCADMQSTEWLKVTVPKLRPWEGAVFRILEGGELPKPIQCTVFIPDENGKRPTADTVLSLLRVSNRGLNTALWTIMGSAPMYKGQLWTFSVDFESLENLRKLGMNPFYGLGKVNFRTKEDQRVKEEAILEKDSAVPNTISSAQTFISPFGNYGITGGVLPSGSRSNASLVSSSPLGPGVTGGSRIVSTMETWGRWGPGFHLPLPEED